MKRFILLSIVWSFYDSILFVISAEYMCCQKMLLEANFTPFRETLILIVKKIAMELTHV